MLDSTATPHFSEDSIRNSRYMRLIKKVIKQDCDNDNISLSMKLK